VVQVDVLRPIDVIYNGAGTSVPSGTLNDVTADDNDATYILFPISSYGDYWSLRVEEHFPPTNMQRHRIRGRVRVCCDANTCLEFVGTARSSTSASDYSTVLVTSSFAEQVSSWISDPYYGLSTASWLSDLNVYGGFPTDVTGATYVHTAEAYIDIDCRLRPTYTPDILDDSGTSRGSDVVADTHRPTFFFGGVSYDDLPPLNWSITCGVFTSSGSGQPPISVVPTVDLPNGSYVATFTVRSTIRESDPFAHIESISFGIDTPDITPPSPDNVSAVYQGDGILVSWEDPGGLSWDNDFVATEILRSDCGEDARRIAFVQDSLTGSFFDIAVPITDANTYCDSESCQITYQVRYHGTVLNAATTSEYADVVIDAPSATSERLVGGTSSVVVSICPDHSYELPRLSARAIQLSGGLPQVSTSGHGRHVTLKLPVTTVNVPTLEAVLAERYVWYAPLVGESGWYAPSKWQVSNATAGVRVVSVTLIRDEPLEPATTLEPFTIIPYDVGIYNAIDNRYDTAGSTLAADRTSSDTSWSIATTAGPIWSTSGPYDLMVAGEQITVTTMTGASSPQTATVIRSVNGVVMAQTAGTAISLYQPRKYG
jgi:hypothetical protein